MSICVSGLAVLLDSGENGLGSLWLQSGSNRHGVARCNEGSQAQQEDISCVAQRHLLPIHPDRRENRIFIYRIEER